MISNEELEKLKVLANDAASYGDIVRMKLIQISEKHMHDMIGWTEGYEYYNQTSIYTNYCKKCLFEIKLETFELYLDDAFKIDLTYSKDFLTCNNNICT